MKALKGLLVYIGIVLAIILGIGFILFAVMYFVPSFRIMGVGVARNNKNLSGNPISITEYNGYTDIELGVNSKKIDIQIVPSNEETIDYKLKLCVFGLSYDKTEYGVFRNVELSGTTLKVTLNVTEPNGLISTNDSVLVVSIPNDKYYSMVINSESGNISVGDTSKIIKIDRFTITTTSGNMNVVGVDEINGDVCNAYFQALNLSTNSGKFNLNELNNIEVSNEIKLSGNNGNFEFNNINASLDATGSGIRLVANEIVTKSNGFKFISENGFFKINKLSTPSGAENTIVTENCNVEIDEISGKTGIISTYGNITIGCLNDYSILSSEHGNISVTKANSDVRITTDMGNISVKSYLKNGTFISRKGNIDVKSTGDYAQDVYTRIENGDGKINVDNKINRLLVNTSGSSKVEIVFRQIKGGLDNPLDVFQHKVNINNLGSALVYMPTMNSVPFKFRAKGKIDGVISGLVSEYEGGIVQSSDNYQYYPSASEETKTACQKSCYFDFVGTITFKGYQNV